MLKDLCTRDQAARTEAGMNSKETSLLETCYRRIPVAKIYRLLVPRVLYSSNWLGTGLAADLIRDRVQLGLHRNKVQLSVTKLFLQLSLP